MIYCVVPEALAGELYEQLVEYYAEDPNVKVIVDRRTGPDRRSGEDSKNDERRSVRDRRRRRAPGSFPAIEPPG